MDGEMLQCNILVFATVQTVFIILQVLVQVNRAAASAAAAAAHHRRQKQMAEQEYVMLWEQPAASHSG